MFQALANLIDKDRAKRNGAKRSPRWPAVRAAHLKAFAVCIACGRKDALNVHHCKPFHLFPELELVETNLITLCEFKTCNCHLILGHCRRWDAWNPNVREDALHFRMMIAQRRVA